MVSSGMHVKFPKYFLKDFIQFWFVTLAGKHQDGHGEAQLRSFVVLRICVTRYWLGHASCVVLMRELHLKSGGITAASRLCPLGQTQKGRL